MSALQALNEDFSDLNPNRGDLVAAFQGLEGDTNVVFALPAKDPDGNPTTGITRHYDPNFVTGDDIAMKELYGWPRHMYLNIYVVYSASGGNSSGFSYLPADVDDWPTYDGVVLSHWACGTTGNECRNLRFHQQLSVQFFFNFKKPQRPDPLTRRSGLRSLIKGREKF